MERKLTTVIGSLDNFSVGGWIISLDVGINGFLHHGVLQLGLCQETPHCWLVAALSILISTVQVLHVSNQDLC